ncbi:hypothetical protein L1987_75644 [Smallanthus sonchifolius]|uniref:Uncharacterized protein n=1 Tax=Smallanthus sonchifolius TaxID=185202 RepID=A0ACB9A5I7_9ASTR|nr:hypothetical protein L1987_75644 [Smallanthus sonchifolius]
MVCSSSSSSVNFLFYSLVIFLTSTTSLASYGGRNETDLQALLKIKLMITQDPYGALTSWNNSLHLCVTCGKRHRRVTGLDLESQGLEGSLPLHVGNLSFLRYLSLFNNSFQGAIPHELGRLSRLRFLNLELNKFNGTIPHNISSCSNLEVLDLSYNELVGSMPKEMSFLSKLTLVSLGNNNLTGGIPPFFGNITSMKVFGVVENPLGGSIPDTLGRCKSLTEFYCGVCNLSGTIPYALFNLSLLTNFSLASNQLSGSLPPTIGAMLPHLVSLQLWGNQLTRPLPPSISNCSRLRSLQMNINKFSGKITIDFGRLRDLSYLRLDRNLFGSDEGEADEMKFIDTFEKMHQIRGFGYFLLQFPWSPPYVNRFQMPLGNLSSLITLYLYLNMLEGVIPSSLGNCHNLFELNLNNNKLKGKISTQLLQLSSLSKQLDLSQNNLFGSLLTEVGDLKMLSVLDLSHNNLSANLIGNGGFSSVYKGILYEYADKPVAIKVLHLQNRGTERSFMRECEAWQNIQQRNLLNIITACSSIDFQGNSFKALVYEFMPNGSLHDWLHLGESTSRFNLVQIINILVDVASALDYIHNHCIPSIVHGDIKPSNILLDDDMMAHVGDFGLALFLGTSYQNSSTGIRGTIGYAALEYGLGNEMTTSGDVYSFGILLLEMMTGKSPMDNIFNEGFSLHKFASMIMPDHV